MKNIILFDPSQATSNMGDYIINEAVMKQMSYIFDDSFLLRYPTHTPLLHLHQMVRPTVISENCDVSDLKFIGGTNILKNNLLIRTPDWNINIFTKSLYKNSILIGCGVGGDVSRVNAYTKNIYKYVLSNDYAHSTRDEKTKNFIESLGLTAINTGCPTTWGLTKSLCNMIPTSKSRSVVFTLTDYAKDIKYDTRLIDILKTNYETIYYWPQGSFDLDYFKTLKNTNGITVIGSSVTSYSNCLSNDSIDYVGTRLHAGIYAMQHKVRSVILAVDNRSTDMQESYNLNVIQREEIDTLNSLINSTFETKISISEENINRWKNQFE